MDGFEGDRLSVLVLSLRVLSLVDPARAARGIIPSRQGRLSYCVRESVERRRVGRGNDCRLGREGRGPGTRLGEPIAEGA